jgi:hypothetical protein
MPGKSGGSNTASKREILPVVERFIESLRSHRVFGQFERRIYFIPAVQRLIGLTNRISSSPAAAGYLVSNCLSRYRVAQKMKIIATTIMSPA